MKRLLCIVGSMDAGGAETFLMKIYRQMDKTKYQMDFCVAKEKKGFYDDEIKSLGGRIYHITPKSKSIIKNFKDILNLVKEQQYKYVMRISQHSLSALELLSAKIGGAKNLIFRSSNSNTGGSRLNQMLHFAFRFLTILIPNIKIAPSTEAAIFMFGKRSVRKNKVLILHNAIPFEKYKFDINKRNDKRKELSLEGKYVIGHVGRLTKQKNHEFLLDVFKIVKEKNKNAILICIGKGELEESLLLQAKKLEIDKDVLFLGVRADVPELMMAMDVFVFPSLYEGLPNTVIEAQATGLKCVISDKITEEVKLTPDTTFLGIEEKDKEQWSKEILNNINIKREDRYKYFKTSGYLIEDVEKIFVEEVFKDRK